MKPGIMGATYWLFFQEGGYEMLGVFIWVVLAALFLLFELSSPGLFFFLSFCFGALAAAAAALISPELLVQGATFVAGTAISFVILKRWVEREQHHGYRTNVDALQGRRGVVIEAIAPNQAGSVKLGGELWSALSAHNEHISADTQVEVLRVRGVHLIVVPLNESSFSSSR